MAIADPLTTPPRAATDQRQTMITFDSVGLNLGGHVIFPDLSFQVAEGEFVCILGPSGCGKSTTLRLMGDLLQPDAGTIRVAGLPPAQAWSHLGYVFQSPRLTPWRTALSNILLGPALRFGFRAAKAYRDRAEEMLRIVRLDNDGHKFPAMLSGGERQRVAIARALVVDPDVVVMDEPFSALDPNTRQRLRLELIDIWQTTGKTIVFVTHDIEEALTLADRILMLSAKPTRILEEIHLPEARPRSLEETPRLADLRRHLGAVFASLESEEP